MQWKRDQGTGHQSGRRSAPGDFVGQNLVIDINVTARHTESEESEGGEHLPVITEAQHGGGEEQTGQQFHDRVADRDGAFAIGASCPQDQPREQRDVMPEGNGILAERAERTLRLMGGEPKGEPVDHHIEVGADTASENEGSSEKRPVDAGRQMFKHEGRSLAG